VPLAPLQGLVSSAPGRPGDERDFVTPIKNSEAKRLLCLWTLGRKQSKSSTASGTSSSGTLSRRSTGSYESARDVVQEAFVRALRQRRSLRDDQALEMWVWRIALRTALEGRRNGASREVALVELADPGLLDAERDPALDVALRQLPPRRRLILSLRYFADLSYAQIAELCEVSEGTVAAAIAQGRAELGRTLDRDEVKT
jgi:RNA polymerase sigma-70 factor (ECF subfamily)